MIALIDADILAYQSAVVCEKPIKWDDDIWTLHAFESEVQARFDQMVFDITDKAKCSTHVLAWTDSHNFRKDVLPTYKSNRAATRRPIVLSAIREWAKENYESRTVPGLEGDDILGIMATAPELAKKVIVCTIDKDLQTIPGHHYNFGKDEEFIVTERDADIYHISQTLTGDTTDGYKGCPGMGAVGAKKLIDKVLEEATPFATLQTLNKMLWDAVVVAYAKAGLGEEEALCQARVARILRNGEINLRTNEVKLWNPVK